MAEIQTIEDLLGRATNYWNSHKPGLAINNHEALLEYLTPENRQLISNSALVEAISLYSADRGGHATKIGSILAAERERRRIEDAARSEARQLWWIKLTFWATLILGIAGMITALLKR